MRNCGEDLMLIKVSAHLEQLKFGKAADATFGIELSYSQSRALFAVQKLLDGTGYVGNAKPVRLDSYDSDIPVLKIRTRDYLNAYGVRRHVTKRGKLEYSGEGRRVAIAALRSLANNDFHLVYMRKLKKQKTQIDTAMPLIALNEAKSRLTIAPAPILIDQIQDYYILKPDNLYDTADRTTLLLIEYLLYHMARKKVRKKDLVVVEQPETIAGKLRLHRLIEERKPGELRQRLNACYQIAKELGYLSSYLTDQPGVKVKKVDVLELKTQKCLPVSSGLSTSNQRIIYQQVAQAPSGAPVSTGVL